MADDGGVLGNLPRSRPGQRSEKRTQKTAAKAARPKTAARKSTGAPKSDTARPGPQGGDPVGGAIRTVAGVAGIGARVAGGFAREVLRRMPRP
jgi:hypothetical protein